jgi:hypothetical protein
LPTAVSFAVTNANLSTTGTPNPSTITFTNYQAPSGRVLRISIQATAPTFTPPGGSATIPASNVSWTTSNAVNGTGFNGTLSSSAYTLVYQSTKSPKITSGAVDLTWNLAAPGTSIRAGNHTLVARWMLESVVP